MHHCLEDRGCDIAQNNPLLDYFVLQWQYALYIREDDKISTYALATVIDTEQFKLSVKFLEKRMLTVME